MSILFVCHLVFSSCSDKSNEKKVDFYDDDSINVRFKLQRVLETENLIRIGLTEEQSLWLQDFYSKRKHKPNWLDNKVLNKSGIKLQAALNRSLWFGIPENRLDLHYKKDLIWIEEEIILTAKMALLLSDLNNGFMNFEEKKYKTQTFTPTEYLEAALIVNGDNSFDQLFLTQGPADSNYRFIVSNLHTFCSSYKIDKTTFDIESIRADSVLSTSKTKIALVSKGYLKNIQADSAVFTDALKLFQKHNGLKQDAVIGTFTSDALNESTHSKVLRAALTLDKMRRKIEYPSKCVRINLPEYLLRLYVNDSLKSIHNIIIGNPTNQTPELKSSINNIVVYPYWNVPYSISSKEILPAVKRNVRYLAKNDFRIFRNDNEVNPYHVSWSSIRENSFPYRVRQDPGPKNSLGIIKFQFHNNYSVYVHDTPAKSLFRRDVRAFSHGCMRCENPVELGKILLDYDSIGKKRNDLTVDSLDTLIFRAENYVIRLKKTVPIFIEYFTVYADRTDLIFYLDIYKRDEEYLKIMTE